MSYTDTLDTIDQSPDEIRETFGTGDYARVRRDPETCMIHIDVYVDGYLDSQTQTDDREIARAVLIHLEIGHDE